jgi:hypothetical protein
MSAGSDKGVPGSGFSSIPSDTPDEFQDSALEETGHDRFFVSPSKLTAHIHPTLSNRCNS